VFAVIWLVSLVEVLRKEDKHLYKNGSQLIWVLVLLLSPPIGAVLYQFMGPARSHPNAEAAVQREMDRQKFVG
jgi:hypothetical protein